MNGKFPVRKARGRNTARRSPTMEPTVGGLIFRDLRHEQRRLAALIPINKVEPLQPVKTSRHSLLPIPLTYPCSHLDPDSTCRDPAHLFLHQRQQLKPIDLLEKLREGFTYIKDKNNQLFKPGGESPLRGWTGEKRAKFDLPLTSRSEFEHAIVEGQGQGHEGSKTWRGPDIERESEDFESDEEDSSAEDEDELHIKIPTEKDDRKGVRRLKGKNETKSKKRAVKKVQRIANEFYPYEEQDGRHGGKGQNGGVGEHRSSDKHYDRELSHDWNDRTDDDTTDPLLYYNHGNAPNPVGREYMAMLEKGQIDQQPTAQRRLFEKRKEPKYDSVVDSFMKERSGSFQRQSLSRKNTFEAEGGLIRVTSFVSEPSFCHCSSPSYIARRENSREFHECTHCGKKTRLQKDSSGSFQRGSSGEMDRESSGEFVRHRTDSGDFVRKQSVVKSRSPSPELENEPKKKSNKKSRKSRRKISRAGDAEDPDFMDKLRQKLDEGKYQVDLDDLPSLDDINQRLRLDAPEEEEPVEEEHYERQYKPPPIRYDQYREAYLKALSVVRGRLLPSESWMLEMNTTRSFVFSYFYSGYPRPRAVPGARNVLPLPDKPPKTKKGAEMKMIFGKENVDDYLPGGPKNPHPGQLAPQKRLGGANIDKKKRKKKVKF